MPHLEKVTQIKIRMPQGGHPNGGKQQEKKAVTNEYKPRYQKTSKKQKKRYWMSSTDWQSTTGNTLYVFLTQSMKNNS